jgi:hypothetical protein
MTMANASALKCDATTRHDSRCTRTAHYDVYHPDAPWASENKTMRLCTQHWNAYSFRGWKLLKVTP